MKHSLPDTLRIFGPAVALTLAGFVLAYQFVDPAPPARIAIATGSADGAYHRFALRYREMLVRHGIALEVIETAGSVDNLERLRTGEVQVAFVQGGVGTPAAEGALLSLASVYFEPLWVFHRAALGLDTLADLAGRRSGVGPEGSGTRAVALALLAANGVREPAASFSPLTGEAAAQALAAGALDAAFLVSGASSPALRTLLEAPGVQLMSFARAQAYTRRHRYLSAVTLPEGAMDLARNVPPRPVKLIAPTANLVARSDFHPALVDLLLAAADEVHRAGGVFEDYGQFPSPRFVEFPLSEQAARHFEAGPSFLRRVLPFWAATLLERLAVMLVPLLALLIPFLRVMPPVYRWRIRSRIYRWYRELLAVDPSVQGGGGAQHRQRALRELARIEEEVAKVHVPLSYADQLYALRVHIELVREKLHAGSAP